jgi:hypothetical protein
VSGINADGAGAVQAASEAADRNDSPEQATAQE